MHVTLLSWAWESLRAQLGRFISAVDDTDDDDDADVVVDVERCSDPSIRLCMYAGGCAKRKGGRKWPIYNVY